ncbi:MAG: hypothetical protein JWQ23_3951 [Herminiimonas sp.]|jgi:uncharacterized protein (DUF58 family)|nr:hypothetical protein [Herminiimonas sp.]
MLRALNQQFHRAADKWLFRLKGVEPGEVFLNQRRVFILPAKPGIGFGVMLVVLFIGAVNYNLSMGFALTFLLASCAIIDMHLTFRNLAHLHLAPGRAPAVFAGDDAQFELHLINRRNHDRYAIWIGFTGTGLPEVARPVDITRHATYTVLLSTPARERGWLTAPRVRLHTGFPLGLLRAWSYWQPDTRVLVYPRPEPNAPPLPIAESAAEDGTGHAGQDDFAGIRAYQAGDSMRRLAWRQIARLGTESEGALVSKHFEGGSASELRLDLSRLPASMGLEARLSCMARWVIEAEALGLPYGFALDDVRYQPAIGPAHQEACLRALALYGSAS